MAVVVETGRHTHKCPCCGYTARCACRRQRLSRVGLVRLRSSAVRLEPWHHITHIRTRVGVWRVPTTVRGVARGGHAALEGASPCPLAAGPLHFQRPACMPSAEHPHDPRDGANTRTGRSFQVRCAATAERSFAGRVSPQMMDGVGGPGAVGKQDGAAAYSHCTTGRGSPQQHVSLPRTCGGDAARGGRVGEG